MKNRFLFVFMLLLFSFGSTVAQTTHWQLSGHPEEWDPMTMTVTMVLQIDGVESTNPNIEMAGFIGDVLMSNGTLPKLEGTRYVYYMSLSGFTNPGATGNKLKFKIYDPESGESSNSMMEIVYVTNGVLGSLEHPLEINFFSDATRWEKVNDPTELKGGDVLYITNLTTEYALSETQNEANRASTAVTYSNGNFTWETFEPWSETQTVYDEETEEEVEVTIWHYPPAGPQIISLHEDEIDGSNLMMFVGDGYLYAGSSSANQLLTGTDITSDACWAFSNDGENISIVAQGNHTHNTLRFAATTQVFNCYEGNKVQAVNVYRLALAGPEVTHTVTATVNDNAAGAVSVSPQQDTYTEGSDVTITAYPIDGYDLASWTVNGNTVEAEGYVYTITSIDQNYEIVANFVQCEYTVTVTVSDEAAGTAGPATGTYHYNDIITLTYTENPGYQFAGWTIATGFGEVVETNGVYTYTVIGPAAITANFTHIEYTVTVTVSDEAAGTAVLAEEGNFYLGSEINVNTTTNEGWQFDNFTTVDGEVVTMPYVIEGEETNIVIVANFTHIEYTVSVTVSDEAAGTAVIVEEEPFYLGSEINVNTTTNEGWQFDNFTINGEVVEMPYTIAGENTTIAIVANFTHIEYTVTVTVSDEAAGTAVLAEEIPFYLGSEINVNTTVNEGWQFDNFTINGEVVEMPYTIAGENTTIAIVANFTHIEYTVSVTVSDEAAGTAVLAEEGPFYLGSEINVNTTTNEGWQFDNFTTVDGEVVTMPYVIEGEETNIVIVANFHQLEYEVTVTVNPAESGTYTIDPEGPYYYYGDQITVTATPTEGYQFVNFTVNDEVVTMPYTVTEAVEITANFLEETVNTYTVSVTMNPEGAGTITGAGTFAEGTPIQLNATANDGYTFDYWTIGGENIETNPYSFELTDNVEVVANFTHIEYTVTVSVSDEAAGTAVLAEEGPFYLGSVINVNTTVNEGYRFVNFTINNGEAVTMPYTIAGENTTIAIVANFELIPTYNITVAEVLNGTVTASAETAEEGEEITVTATPAEGYELTALYFVNAETEAQVVIDMETMKFEMPAADVTIYATFELIPVIPTYNITVAEVENGTVTASAETAEEGEEITVTATPAEGYELTALYFVNAETEAQVVIDMETMKFEMPAADVTIYATFELIPVIPTYNITVAEVENGTVTASAETAEEGEEITVTATPAEGYELTALYFVNAETEAQVVIDMETMKFEMPAADVTIYATFELIPVIPTYNITVAEVENGTVTASAETAEEGEEITVTATPAEGYELTALYFVNAETEAQVVIDMETMKFEMPAADVTIYATFELIPVIPTYTITVAEVENGTITAPASAEEGATVTVTVNANPMYHLSSLYFVNEETEESTDIDLNTKQFEMPAANVTIYGEFILVSGKGDVNMDGDVNILDVIVTFNYILEMNPQLFDFDQADMNENGEIEISDAMAINSMILGLKADCEESSATYGILNGKLFIDTEVALAGYQFRLSAEPTVIDMPGFTTMSNWSNGEFILCIFNLNGEKESGLYPILDLGDANVNNVVLSTKEGCLVRGIEGVISSVNSFDERDYSIYPVPANNQVTVAGPGINQIEVFNMMGQCVMVVNDVNADETVVSVNHLTAGSYLFRIHTNNGVAAKNVVVVK